MHERGLHLTDIRDALMHEPEVQETGPLVSQPEGDEKMGQEFSVSSGLSALSDALNYLVSSLKAGGTEKWVERVSEVCTELELLTPKELADELRRVAAMRQLSVEAEALLHLLAAKGLADSSDLVALALDLRSEGKLQQFIERLRREKGDERAPS